MERHLDRFRAFPSLLLAGDFGEIASFTRYPSVTFFDKICIVATGPADTAVQLGAQRLALLRAGACTGEAHEQDVYCHNGRVTIEGSNVYFAQDGTEVGRSRFNLFGEGGTGEEGFSMIEVTEVAMPEVADLLTHWNDLRPLRLVSSRAAI